MKLHPTCPPPLLTLMTMCWPRALGPSQSTPLWARQVPRLFSIPTIMLAIVVSFLLLPAIFNAEEVGREANGVEIQASEDQLQQCEAEIDLYKTLSETEEVRRSLGRYGDGARGCPGHRFCQRCSCRPRSCRRCPACRRDWTPGVLIQRSSVQNRVLSIRLPTNR